MVKIVNFKSIEMADGEVFYALVLQGDVEPVKSQKTGKTYFTARKAIVPTTFDEVTCKSAIGTSFNGEIRKVECEPYEYAVKDTGEVIVLTHRWEYVEDASIVQDNNIDSLTTLSLQT